MSAAIFVARMERSVIRGGRCRTERLAPDFAALHPGYEGYQAMTAN